MFTSTNRPTLPGAIIGYRKNGTPIRLIGGGSEDAGAAGGTGTGQEGATGGNGTSTDPNAGGGGDGGGGTSGATGTGSAASTGGGAGGGGGAADDTPKVIAAIREDYKAERARRQSLEKDLADLKAANTKRDEETQARNLALAKALGIAVDETPDPEKLAADLKAAQAQVQEATVKSQARERELTVELQLMRQAARHGANPELLADSRTFMAQVAGLDPSSDSFGDDLGDAIKAAVEANPAYKLAQTAAGTQTGTGGGNGAQGEGNGNGAGGTGAQARKPAAPARSGGEHTTPGGNRQWTLDDVKAASARNPREVVEAIEQGLLIDLGYHPTRQRR
ncbi:MAG: hypothetical protein ACRDP5_24150 [Streptosporangiaceae bacterium]